MKLYSARLSPNGKRVRICAAELGLVLDEVIVDLERGDPRSPEYLAKNPMGKWPTLEDGDLVIWESGAILCHLAGKVAGHGLLPADPGGHTEVLKWMFFGSCHLDPYFTQLVLERFVKRRRGATHDDRAAALAVEWLGRFLPVVDATLRDREHVAGPAFTLADIVLGCTLELSPLVAFDLDRYANVAPWLSRIAERPSWKAADRGATP